MGRGDNVETSDAAPSRRERPWWQKVIGGYFTVIGLTVVILGGLMLIALMLLSTAPAAPFIYELQIGTTR